MSAGGCTWARKSVARGVWLLPLADLAGLFGGALAVPPATDARPDRVVAAATAGPAHAVTATGAEAAAGVRPGGASPDAEMRPARGRGDDDRRHREVTPTALLDMPQLQALGVDVRQAALTFAELALRPPAPATLDAGLDGHPSAEPALRARLRSIGHKTHANRAWRRYWVRQRESIDALSAALLRLPPPANPQPAPGGGAGAASAGAGAPPAAPQADPHDPATWAEQLRAYRQVVDARISSEDALLVAIEAERDVIEERLEALLEAAEPARPVEAASTGRLSAYERRTRNIDELERRVEQQRHKRSASVSELELLQRQIQTAQALERVLDADAELAGRELAATSADNGAGASLRRPPPWRAVWQRLHQAVGRRSDRLSAELEGERGRARLLEVDASLAEAQLAYRAGRIAQLERQLEAANGASSWLQTARQQIVEWLLRDAWRALAAVLGIWLAARLALRITDRALAAWRRRAEGDPDDAHDDDTRALTLATVAGGITRPAIWIIAAMLGLEAVGLSASPLLGSAAILGLAISFGSQNLVRDLVNGFFILVEHQYAVGETVDIGGKVGEVERVTIRSTWLRQSNGDLHVIPNGAITVVSNLTRTWSRAIVEIGVHYDSNIEHVKSVVEATGAELFADPDWSARLTETPTWVGIVSLADSAVVHRIWVQVRAGDQWAVQRELNRRLKIAFDREGIQIPYPQRVVWHRDAPTDPPKTASKSGTPV